MNIKNIIPVLFACLLFQISIFSQQSITAKVVGVVDGDTITVFTNDKRQLMIRFAGIDAPEKDQDFGTAAKEQLAGVIFDQSVTIAGLKNDCLNRLSASVSFKNRNLNLLLVEAGNAWADNSCEDNETFSIAESAAKEKKIGLWQYSNPVRPDVFLTTKESKRKLEQEKERKIFGGLAPTREIAGGILFIGMTQNRFMEACGNKGFPTDTLTSQYSQTFRVDFPVTSENLKNGCAGSFIFQRDSPRKPFRLVDATN